jgi:Flp pilus assembly protein TadD
VRASARSAEPPEDVKSRLAEARSAARERPTDPRALKAWATAAMRAGETREARRAAEAWAVHDAGAEPRLFLAGALDQAGRKREARAVLEEWLANHPDSVEARRMVSRLGASPEPAIKRGSRSRNGRIQLHPLDPFAADE